MSAPHTNGHHPATDPADGTRALHRDAVASLDVRLRNSPAEAPAVEHAAASAPPVEAPPGGAAPAARRGLPRPLAEWWDDPDPGPRATLVPVDGAEGTQAPGLLYPGMSHLLAAPAGSGKTWIALAMALTVIGQHPDRPALLVDYESSAPVMVHRLRLLGATRAQAQRVAYLSADTALDRDGDALAAWVGEHRPAVTVLDAVTDATALAGVDSDRDNAGYVAWHRHTEHLLGVDGTAEGSALVLVDHISTKTGEGQLVPRGVTSKAEAVTGAAYALAVDTPPAPGHQGRARLRVAKDRHTRGRGETAARVTITPQPDTADDADGAGALGVAFTTPGSRDGDTDPRPRERHVAEAIRAELARQSLSRRRLCEVVQGDDSLVRGVVERMYRDGELVDDTSQPARGGSYPLTLAPGAAAPTVDDDEEEPF